MPEQRFLTKDEYSGTKALARDCFPDDDGLEEYYAKDISDTRIAALTEDGAYVSMAHLRRMTVTCGKERRGMWYILYVCTVPQKRRKGYMHRLLRFVLDTLKSEGERGAFLLPVDPEIYRSLGFVHSFSVSPKEAELLYADDGLTECKMCLFENEEFLPPEKIEAAESIYHLSFSAFSPDAAAELFSFFSARPNRSYDSVATDTLLWSEEVATEWAVLDGCALLLRDKTPETVSGALPFCPQTELFYYFKLFERYFNEVLSLPFSAFYSDAEGVEFLKKTGALRDYEIREETEIFDYIYDAEALRTLKGRAYAQKRNHIHKFQKLFGERWEYRTLYIKDAPQIYAFLDEWEKNKTVEQGADLWNALDASDALRVELAGIRRILSSEAFCKKIKMGGIFVDGRLSAFSMGAYNEKERMAIIEVEKADASMEGLYQLINREFLVHEFPEAHLVNREDDVGLPGLRKSKMSYHPVLFEKRYSIIQKNF